LWRARSTTFAGSTRFASTMEVQRHCRLYVRAGSVANHVPVTKDSSLWDVASPAIEDSAIRESATRADSISSAPLPLGLLFWIRRERAGATPSSRNGSGNTSSRERFPQSGRSPVHRRNALRALPRRLRTQSAFEEPCLPARASAPRRGSPRFMTWSGTRAGDVERRVSFTNRFLERVSTQSRNDPIARTSPNGKARAAW
jgi:hypothetical protein